MTPALRAFAFTVVRATHTGADPTRTSVPAPPTDALAGRPTDAAASRGQDTFPGDHN
ncbi:MAG: hypothetical protein ACRDUA_22495 [Micromonosporaceae bacterium]